MRPAAPSDIQRLIHEFQPRPSAWLLGLMIASAATEGFGLLLLVPLLSQIEGEKISGISAWLSRSGFNPGIGVLLAIFVVVIATRAIVAHTRVLASQRFEGRITDCLRVRAWDALLHCEWRVASQIRRSESDSLLITNIERVGDGIDQLVTILATSVTLGGVCLAALAISPLLVAVAVASGLAVLTAYSGLRRHSQQLGLEANHAIEAMHREVAEGLQSIRAVKSLGLEQRVLRSGSAAFAAARQAELAKIMAFGVGQIILQSGGAALLALGVWIAFVRFDARIAEIVPLVALFARGLPLLTSLQSSLQNLHHSLPAIAQVYRFIDTAEAAREPDAEEIPAPGLKHQIEFRKVGLIHHDNAQAVLAEADFTIPAGTIAALVGASGAGKSTIADLAAGLVVPDSGAILIDGTELAGPHRRAWRGSVAYVEQESIVFNATVRENLLAGCPGAGPDELARAIRAASADFLLSPSLGLDTLLGDGGRRLSGGEAQRLALARALLCEPALLILDEATSALDQANEAAVVKAISALKGTLTILVIGHRGKLVALADRTFVVAGGKVTFAD